MPGVVGECAASIKRDDYQTLIFFFCIGNVGDPKGHVLAINHAALWVGMRDESRVSISTSILTPADGGEGLLRARAVFHAGMKCLEMCVLHIIGIVFG